MIVVRKNVRTKSGLNIFYGVNEDYNEIIFMTPLEDIATRLGLTEAQLNDSLNFNDKSCLFIKTISDHPERPWLDFGAYQVFTKDECEFTTDEFKHETYLSINTLYNIICAYGLVEESLIPDGIKSLIVNIEELFYFII